MEMERDLYIYSYMGHYSSFIYSHLNSLHIKTSVLLDFFVSHRFTNDNRTQRQPMLVLFIDIKHVNDKMNSSSFTAFVHRFNNSYYVQSNLPMHQINKKTTTEAVPCTTRQVIEYCLY